ncbi:MAG: acyl carrier protein [Scytonema sp. RU_4_4]|nr:acyl carrier protein [Scytonema sp. RU_4_4]
MKNQDIQVTQMPKESPTEAKIQAWLVSYLAELLEIDSDEIDVTIPFDRYGLDSSALVGLTGDLEAWLGRELDPTLLYDYPTIDALVQHLIEESKVKV